MTVRGQEGAARPRVAIAIVSWNTRDLLARCLESLAPDVEDGLVEVWVVDNASGDGSPDLVRGRFPWARLVALEENIGFGRAVNLVARRTETEWIAAANADIAPEPGSVEALLAAGDRDPGAGAIAPRLVLPTGDTQHSVFGFPTIPATLAAATGAYAISASLGDRLAFPGRWDPTRARRVPWAVAAFLLVRRSTWDDTGGFDEAQWMYAEDLELGWRLRDAGWATRYEPRAVVRHESAAATTQMFGPELEPHWQRSTYECVARRRGWPYARTVALLNVAGALVRAVLAARRPDARRGYARWARIHAEAGGLRRPASP